MNKTLLKFLTEHEGKGLIWFIVPGGIVVGTLRVLESLNPDAITLIDATIRRGDILQAIGVAHVVIAQISAWGEYLGIM